MCKWYKALLLIVIIPLVFQSRRVLQSSHYDLETSEDYTRRFIYLQFTFLCYFFVMVSGDALWQECHRSDTGFILLDVPWFWFFLLLMMFMFITWLRGCLLSSWVVVFSKNPFGSLCNTILQCYFNLVHSTL